MVVVAIDGIAQGEPYRLVAVWSSACNFLYILLGKNFYNLQNIILL